MSSERFRQVEALFEQACSLATAERAAFLERACDGDRSLRSEVEALLGHDDKPHGMLVGEAPGTRLRNEALELIAAEERTSLPTNIGKYRILDVLGEGGMGVVYLAEQDTPRRTVALKVMRTALASANMLRRFEHEVEVLGRLQHPGIAQIFEAGVYHAEEGRRLPPQPFFAMEYVRGKPLLEHAESRKLGTRERLELLVRICAAVHHAHQQGVIHRDLKPSNILVVESEDGSGQREVSLRSSTFHAAAQPKILDFGIARSTDADIHASTLRTDIGQMIGTIPYMSPEQVGGDPAKVDIRSDVYALGVMMYELLAGRLPHDLKGKSVPEAARIIGQQDHTPLSSISKFFRGDLDTIVNKALEKDPERRYGSAAEFAADIQRYLDDQPIVARPASTFYQLQKFAKRNKALVAAVVAVFIVLVVASITASTLWFRAVRDRDRAQDAQSAEKIQRGIADDKTRQANYRAYLADIAAADAAMRVNDVVAMASRLSLVRDEKADTWECRFLRSRLDDSRAEFQSSANAVYEPRFSPDDTRLAVGGWDRTVTIWDLRESPPTASMIRAHDGLVLATMWSADGSMIATGSNDHTACVWNPDTGALVKAFFGHALAVRGVSISPDGTKLATASSDKTARIWDIRTGQTILTLSGHTDELCDIAWSPDGTLVATSSEDRTARVWDAATGELKARLAGHLGRVMSVRFTPSGKRVLTGSEDKTARLWDVADGREVVTFRGNTSDVRAADISPDGRHVATCCKDHTVRLFDAKTGEPEGVLCGHLKEIQGLCYSHDGATIASTSLDGVIKLWDAVGDQATLLKGNRRTITSIDFSPDGARLASSGEDGTIRLWDVASGLPIATLEEPSDALKDGVRSVCYSADGRWLVSGASDAAIRIRDARTGAVVRTMRGHENSVYDACFSPDGQRILSCSADQTVRVWDVATGEQIFKFADHHSRVRCAKFSPDGSIIASCGDDRNVRLYDAKTGQALHVLQGHTGLVFTLAFSRDGRRLFSSSSDANVRCWDPETGTALRPTLPHAEACFGFALAPDGTRLATGSFNGSIHLWDAMSGEEIMTLRGHDYNIYGMAFSPDGRLLASAGQDRYVHLWDTQPIADRLAARRQATRMRSEHEPSVKARFDALHDADRVIQAIMDDTSLSPREREIESQLALGVVAAQAKAAATAPATAPAAATSPAASAPAALNKEQ